MSMSQVYGAPHLLRLFGRETHTPTTRTWKTTRSQSHFRASGTCSESFSLSISFFVPFLGNSHLQFLFSWILSLSDSPHWSHARLHAAGWEKSGPAAQLSRRFPQVSLRVSKPPECHTTSNASFKPNISKQEPLNWFSTLAVQCLCRTKLFDRRFVCDDWWQTDTSASHGAEWEITGLGRSV